MSASTRAMLRLATPIPTSSTRVPAGSSSLYEKGGLPSNVTLTSQGFLAGAQFGYDRVFYEKFVAGLEADLQGITSGNANYASWQGSPATYVQAGRNVPYLGTVSGRFGYLVTPAWLVYDTGGLSFGETDLRATYFSPTLKPNLYQGGSWLGYDDMRLGWTAGAGVEWMFNPKWSVKAEYLYYNLGTAKHGERGPLVLYQHLRTLCRRLGRGSHGHVRRACHPHGRELSL